MKHVEQFTQIKNCITLHLVGHTLEYIYDAWNHKREMNTMKLLLDQNMHRAVRSNNLRKPDSCNYKLS